MAMVTDLMAMAMGLIGMVEVATTGLIGMVEVATITMNVVGIRV